MRILLIEDEKALSAAVCRVLQGEGYETTAVYDGSEGLLHAMTDSYDAIILDVMLPGLDGFSVLRELRKKGKITPVLMLTARGTLADRVKGLESGADYYLPKPFQSEELIACLHTITRRGTAAPRMGLEYGGTRMNEKEHGLRCEETGQEVRLSAKEYQLMEFFLRNPGQVLTKELIMERIWGIESDADYNNVEVYISFLRKKLSFIGSRLRFRVVRGTGYALEEEK